MRTDVTRHLLRLLHTHLGEMIGFPGFRLTQLPKSALGYCIRIDEAAHARAIANENNRCLARQVYCPRKDNLGR